MHELCRAGFSWSSLWKTNSFINCECVEAVNLLSSITFGSTMGATVKAQNAQNVQKGNKYAVGTHSGYLRQRSPHNHDNSPRVEVKLGSGKRGAPKKKNIPAFNKMKADK